jgi:DNA-binding transcriptional LysR family regulator
MIKDLNALLVFAKVVEAHSFSEAARRLKMPISTVSRRIVELEDQLGVRLLDRSTRNLRLTELGAEVLEQARQVYELSEAVDDIISNKMSVVSGTLRLCAPPSVSDSLIAPVVTAFQASYPNVNVQVYITERIVDQIADDVDVAFKVGTFTIPSLVARKQHTRSACGIDELSARPSRGLRRNLSNVEPLRHDGMLKDGRCLLRARPLGLGPSTLAQSPRMPGRCFWARQISPSG